MLSAGAGPEGSTRRRVYALVERYPGLHQREIGRQLDMRPSHVEHHLRHLLRAGLVRAMESEGYTRYFANVTMPGERAEHAVGAADARWLAVLRQPRPLHIVGILLRDDGVPMRELAAQAHISAGTLTYQLDKLEEAGIIVRIREGRTARARLVDRERLVHLLLDHEPPDDLVAGFQELWDDVGL